MIEREYGKYHAKIYFAKEDVPETEEKLLDAIMQSFRQRLDREGRKEQQTIKVAESSPRKKTEYER